MADPNPLHQTATEPDEAWGANLGVVCDCGQEHRLWDKKCRGCKKKNYFPKLVKKRKKIEKWFDTRIRKKNVPGLEKNQGVLEVARKFDAVLEEIERQPFPRRHKKEDINAFLRRVVGHFPALFRASSPKQKALGLEEEIRRTSVAFSRSAWDECHRIIDELSANPAKALQGTLLAKQAGYVSVDLQNMIKPYLEALSTLQLSHNRLVTAYGPARELFRRDHTTGKGKAILNKARSMLKPVGNMLKFPTAIWKDDAELESLKRFDGSLSKFVEQAQWFRPQYGKLQERNQVLINAYSLSLRRYLVGLLVERCQTAGPDERNMAVKNVLGQKGIGSFFYRLFFGGGNKKPGPVSDKAC